eukprot:c386_g1_i1 orf=159-386(+)
MLVDTVRVKSHPYSKCIYYGKNLRMEGYSPCLQSLSHIVSDDEKKHAVCLHSEKLVMAYDIVNMPEGTTMRMCLL